MVPAPGRVLGGWAARVVPVALLALAAGVHDLRPPIVALLLAGFGVAHARGDPRAPGWAATLPVAFSLVWGLVPDPVAATDRSDCANPLSPPAVWRLGEAILALVCVVIVGRIIRADLRDLGIRPLAAPLALLAAVGAVLAGLSGLLAGERLAEPFFGSFALDLGQPGAIVPALVFAGSNGAMEEIVYRGSLQAWLGGDAFALVAQALVFGLVHTGSDVGGPAILVVAGMAVAGAIAGLIVRRTGSLALPIAIHIAFDITVYFYWACRFVS